MGCEQAFEYLSEQEYIDYGKFIPRMILESALGVKYVEKGWDWNGPYLQLKGYIEEQGYFCTAKGCPEGSLKILEANEMSHRMECINETTRRRQRRALNSMRNADTSALSEHEKAEFEHSKTKNVLLLKMFNSVLHELN